MSYITTPPPQESSTHASNSGEVSKAEEPHPCMNQSVVDENATQDVAQETAQPDLSKTQISVDEVTDCIEVPSVEPTVETVLGEALCEMEVPSLGHVRSYYEDPESDGESTEDDDDGSSPSNLANRIRNLVTTLASRSRPAPDAPPSDIPERILRDSITGQPVPFPDAAFLIDTDLTAKLRSKLAMNGGCRCSKGKGLAKQSVWDVLDSYKAPPAHKWCADLPDVLARNTDRLDTLPTSIDGHIIVDDSSVMMYFPLVPDKSSQVELAQSNLVPITAPSTGKEKPKTKKLLKRYRMYDTFKKGDGEVERDRSLTWKFWSMKPKLTSPSAEVITAPSSPAKPEVKQRVWVPSNTKMSVQALWWGYRLFLPPPVLEILSHEEVEATKRVSMIATSLSWMFANLPVTLFPPPMQPALLMLQKLLPYLSYIGTFISWSWDTIKSFDEGHGVILSATWLLPVALIPGTWETYDYPVQSQESEEPEPEPKLDFAARLPTSVVSLVSRSRRSSIMKEEDSKGSRSRRSSIISEISRRLSLRSTSPSFAQSASDTKNLNPLMSTTSTSLAQSSRSLASELNPPSSTPPAEGKSFSLLNVQASNLPVSLSSTPITVTSNTESSPESEPSNLPLPPSSMSLASSSPTLASNVSSSQATSTTSSLFTDQPYTFQTSSSLLTSNASSQVSDSTVSSQRQSSSSGMSSTSLRPEPSSSHSIETRIKTDSEIFPLPSPYSASKISSDTQSPRPIAIDSAPTSEHIAGLPEQSAAPATPARPITGLPKSTSGSPVLSPTTAKRTADAIQMLEKRAVEPLTVAPAGREGDLNVGDVKTGSESVDAVQEVGEIEQETEKPFKKRKPEHERETTIPKSDSVLSDRTNREQEEEKRDVVACEENPLPNVMSKEEDRRGVVENMPARTEDKKEKRKSRGLVGGLWRLLTGSG
ncbi:hypothetical protein Moror_7088 [Moniliophthora roreri MCA 2997]|uniref:Uncharacterized protein n=1 Tax=Moniliophthora roreri (strain MCA 2997) TaxID=1381753 RepID=V2XRE2_MONRO|nr:hypothetical protein Moror_7088 [Moniliophthora roreri MCA 2997]